MRHAQVRKFRVLGMPLVSDAPIHLAPAVSAENVPTGLVGGLDVPPLAVQIGREHDAFTDANPPPKFLQ